jgi:hypothetical protein
MPSLLLCVALCLQLLGACAAGTPAQLPAAPESESLRPAGARGSGATGAEHERLIAASKMNCCWARLGLEVPTTDSEPPVSLRLKTDEDEVDGMTGRHCSPDTCQHCHTSHNCKRHKRYCEWKALNADHPKEGMCLQRPAEEEL